MADVKKSSLHYMRLPTPPETPSQPAEPNSPGKDVPGCKQWTWKASNSGASGLTLLDSCASQEPFHAVARRTLTAWARWLRSSRPRLLLPTHHDALHDPSLLQKQFVIY